MSYQSLTFKMFLYNVVKNKMFNHIRVDKWLNTYIKISFCNIDTETIT